MHVIIRLIALMKDIHTGNEGSSTVLKEMKPSHFFAQVLRVALALVVCMTLFHRIDPTEDRSSEESWLPCLSTDDDWTWYPPPPCDAIYMRILPSALFCSLQLTLLSSAIVPVPSTTSGMLPFRYWVGSRLESTVSHGSFQHLLSFTTLQLPHL